MTENTVQPLSIAIALFDRMTMLDAIGPYSVLAGLPRDGLKRPHGSRRPGGLRRHARS
jgi:hypothetical protein